jgi:phenylacetate-CoA ligase
MRRFFIFTLVRLFRTLRKLAAHSDAIHTTILFHPYFEKPRAVIGVWKAWYAFEKARKDTPAYSEFIHKNRAVNIPLRGFIPDLSIIPISDKKNYVKEFSIESRCVGGKLPLSGVVIDESSGSSGQPNNWVRGQSERDAIRKGLGVAFRQAFGTEQRIVINAFALGPWATGMNVSMSLVDVAVLKSTGPDIEKIVHTLNFLGPKYKYVIMGYPPFLKALVDDSRISWKDFDCMAVFGGEGVSEEMRSYLSKGFKKLYSSYGASDLEINIGVESDFSIALRQELVRNDNLRERLGIKGQSVVPMIFQYNPLDYYIESTDDNELVVTLCRSTNVSPKIRYNIHDTGTVMSYRDVQKILKELHITLAYDGEAPRLPCLFHYGRADLSVAFYGSKITPANIESIIFSDKDLAYHINAFALLVHEDEQVNKRLTLALELQFADKDISLTETQLTERIFQSLKEINQDYREASRMIPEGLEPQVSVYRRGEGPFASNDIRTKRNYIQYLK